MEIEAFVGSEGRFWLDILNWRSWKVHSGSVASCQPTSEACESQEGGESMRGGRDSSTAMAGVVFFPFECVCHQLNSFRRWPIHSSIRNDVYHCFITATA